MRSPGDEQGVNAELNAAIEMLHGEQAIPRSLNRVTLAWVFGQTEEASL